MNAEPTQSNEFMILTTINFVLHSNIDLCIKTLKVWQCQAWNVCHVFLSTPLKRIYTKKIYEKRDEKITFPSHLHIRFRRTFASSFNFTNVLETTRYINNQHLFVFVPLWTTATHLTLILATCSWLIHWYLAVTTPILVPHSFSINTNWFIFFLLHSSTSSSLFTPMLWMFFTLTVRIIR